VEYKNQTILTAGIVNKNNTIYSPECLKKAIKKLKGKELPITRDFNQDDVVGKSKNFSFENGIVKCDATLNEDGKKLFLAPAMQVPKIDEKDGVTIIHKGKFTSVGLVEKHADPNVPSL
jgi:hypothetical protein